MRKRLCYRHRAEKLYRAEPEGEQRCKRGGVEGAPPWPNLNPAMAATDLAQPAPSADRSDLSADRGVCPRVAAITGCLAACAVFSRSRRRIRKAKIKVERSRRLAERVKPVPRAPDSPTNPWLHAQSKPAPPRRRALRPPGPSPPRPARAARHPPVRADRRGGRSDLAFGPADRVSGRSERPRPSSRRLVGRAAQMRDAEQTIDRQGADQPRTRPNHWRVPQRRTRVSSALRNFPGCSAMACSPRLSRRCRAQATTSSATWIKLRNSSRRGSTEKFQ